MKIFGRIENEIIKEVIQIDETIHNIKEMFHPSLIWEEISEVVKEGWLRVEGIWTAPPPPPTPAPTEAPEPTQAPVTTEAPETTPAPTPTDAPVTTSAPVTTDAPVTTPAPTTAP